MPQASDELRAEWNGPSDETAKRFLRAKGFAWNMDWTWSSPGGREPTDKEWSAITFMIHEWDSGSWAGKDRPA